MKSLFVFLWIVFVTAVSAKDQPKTEQDRYFDLAMRRNGTTGLSPAGEAVLKANGGDAGRLNQFAWQILTEETLVHRDFPLALRAARRAADLTKNDDITVLDTYARALFATGKTNDAIETQQKAIALCRSPKQRLELKETLLDYQQPSRFNPEGWEDERVFRGFMDKSVALVESQRTVGLAALLDSTDVQPFKVKLLDVSRRPITSEQLYEKARASLLVVGTLVKHSETGEWEMSLASGFVVHESGIFVTNFHVLNESESGGMTAMTSDGKVYPVNKVLAVWPMADIAVCQLDGASRLPALPIAPNPKPGARVRVLSHPDNAFYSLTEGVVSRYFVYRNQGKATTMLATTAEFAVGSSGAPLLDDCGNVIGMVSSTSSIYSGPATMDGEGEMSGSAPEADSNGDLQMVMKMCVPSADILKLLGK